MVKGQYVPWSRVRLATKSSLFILEVPPISGFAFIIMDAADSVLPEPPTFPDVEQSAWFDNCRYGTLQQGKLALQPFVLDPRFRFHSKVKRRDSINTVSSLTRYHDRRIEFLCVISLPVILKSYQNHPTFISPFLFYMSENPIF